MTPPTETNYTAVPFNLNRNVLVRLHPAGFDWMRKHRPWQVITFHEGYPITKLQLHDWVFLIAELENKSGLMRCFSTNFYFILEKETN